MSAMNFIHRVCKDKNYSAKNVLCELHFLQKYANLIKTGIILPIISSYSAIFTQYSSFTPMKNENRTRIVNERFLWTHNNVL